MKFRFVEQKLIAEISEQTNELYPEQEIFGMGQSPDNPSESIVAAENLEPFQVVETVCSKKVQHLVQRNEGRFEGHLISTARLLSNPQAYFESDFQFFPDANLSSITVRFHGAEEKSKLKEQTFQFTANLGGSSLVSAADSIIEELYMNAVIDAPREAQAKGQAVSERESEFYLCQSKQWLQISCTDFYGSLEISRFLGRMQEVYKNGAGEMINMEKPGGAGLGCVILFENSVSLFLGVQRGTQTKVTCLIPLETSNRQRAEMKKSLHWFEI